MKYDDYFKLLSLPEYSKLRDALFQTVKTLSRDQETKESLAEKLQALGASQDISQIIATCIWVRRDEIHTQLVKDSCSMTQSRLDDFDWRLKV